jgi:hypothetical protein
MSTFVDVLPQTLSDICEPETIEVDREEYDRPELSGWDPDTFADEQIRGCREKNLPGEGCVPCCTPGLGSTMHFWLANQA